MKGTLLKISVGVLLAVLAGAWIVGRNIEVVLNRVDSVTLPRVSERAMRIHASTLVVDLHADSLLFGRDLLERSRRGQVDLPRLREGGVGLQFFTIVTRVPMSRDINRTSADAPDVVSLLGLTGGLGYATRSPYERALLQLSRLADTVARSQGGLMAVESRDDLQSLIDARKRDPNVVGALSGIEGAHALDGELANVDELFNRGLRMLALTHFFDNRLAGSAHGVERHGLTALGRRVIARSEELGIVIDLAHLSPAAIDDVLSIVTAPTLVSHTGVRGTCDNPRNLSDRHIRAIAKGGGVIGIGYFEMAICGRELSDIVAAMRHIRDLVGADHIALGSDYDGSIIAGFDTSQIPAITQTLLDQEFSEEEVRKIIGGNVVRVLRAVLPPVSKRL